ncbi:EamA family transporter [Atopomonas sediminilitoris]|uniref:EamA family transporter n=1 Tax=Atopomonas sediminilitoris TaxID=2919919 RepID=UPI001F4E1AE8|nr:EamA family transporter [Atopomonas sediminilitoris]MCJ8170530.1 EamA family transporter [Atopomonas sediminilitoris]
MSGLTLLLVLLSALAHASWNLAGKKASPTLGYFCLASWWGFLLGLPAVLLLAWPLLSALTAPIWGWLVLTGLCQCLYLWGLANAYQRGELSALYPLIRSSPLILLLIGSLWLGTAERISTQAVVGIVLIVGGCFFLPMQRFSDWQWRNYLNQATLFALLAATATAGYSLVDDIATRAIRELPEHNMSHAGIALVYVVLQAGTASVWTSLAMLLPGERAQFKALPIAWHSSLFTGVMMLVTYALVVWAMAYASDVSYVVALRQVSIPIGVGLGIALLGERMSGPKLLGVSIVVSGLVLVVLG